jgi:hypothetical protein
MPFQTLDALTGIEATHTTKAPGFDALAIQAPGTRVCVTPCVVAFQRPQYLVNTSPVALFASAPEMVIDGLPAWVAAGQVPPLAARHHHKPDGIHNALG